MKKNIISCLLILSLFLGACGCAEREQTSDDNDTNLPDAPDIPTSTEVEPLENPENNSEEVDSISQEDLDRLKADLEGMEFDDLSGFSE
ncbi:hypothetical protein V7O62_12910 [Methanolobus sp. ZRKC2]|uniref:hypothetical protein n=1 Tax=Methanolobus sp. ZRKC2 TaxID=3125783 RepID=UPI0032472931